jgi:hypothetical protein
MSIHDELTKNLNAILGKPSEAKQADTPVLDPLVAAEIAQLERSRDLSKDALYRRLCDEAIAAKLPKAAVAPKITESEMRRLRLESVVAKIGDSNPYLPGPNYNLSQISALLQIDPSRAAALEAAAKASGVKAPYHDLIEHPPRR